MKIDENTFMITGAASGLGAATARFLVRAGANVVICDTNRSAGELLANELGDQARFALTDITNEENCRSAIALAQREFGALRGLVNCAGIGPAERVLGKNGPHDLESFSRCIQINLVGTFNMLRLASEAIALAEPLASEERGVIVITASAAAYEGQIGQAAYSASKGGLVAMTLPIARELARFGIRVMTVAPGLFKTPIMASLPETALASLAASVPFPQRLGMPEEFASLVHHIIENEMLNGEVIRIDGAIRFAPK